MFWEHKINILSLFCLDLDGNEKHHKVFTLHVPMYVCSSWCKLDEKRKKKKWNKKKRNKFRNLTMSFCILLQFVFSLAGVNSVKIWNMALKCIWTHVCFLYSFVPGLFDTMTGKHSHQQSCKYVVMYVNLWTCNNKKSICYCLYNESEQHITVVLVTLSVLYCSRRCCNTFESACGKVQLMGFWKLMAYCLNSSPSILVSLLSRDGA